MVFAYINNITDVIFMTGFTTYYYVLLSFSFLPRFPRMNCRISRILRLGNHVHHKWHLLDLGGVLARSGLAENQNLPFMDGH